MHKNQRLSEMLFRTRLSKGLTQEKAAEEIGTSKSSYINWEKGRNRPLPREYQGIAKFLDKSIEEVSVMVEGKDLAKVVDNSGASDGLTYRECALIAMGVVSVVGAIIRGELDSLFWGNPILSLLTVSSAFLAVYFIQTRVINKLVEIELIQRITNWFSSGPVMIGGVNVKE